mgnify:CR=1 FL=1
MSEELRGSDEAVLGLELDDDEYTVKQSLFRNKYRVYDSEGDLVLQTKQKLLKMREEFPFSNADGDTVFRVTAKNLLDVAGDYALVDERTDETVLVLTKNFTFFHHKWTLKRPDGEVLATVESRSAMLEALRSLVDVLSFLPHKYDIRSDDGRQVGEIAGRFSLRDVYDIRIDDPGELPRTALVAGAVAIDALEGN